jgi:molecular chaperone DnaK
MPQIEVIFDIDANGILNVTAKDKATAKEQSMQIIPSSGLNDSEIDQMVKDAERHRDEDARRRSHIEARNQADSLIFAAEKTLREQGDQISSELKLEIESKVEATKKVIETDDTEALKQATGDLGQTLQKVGAEMYGAGGPGMGGTGPTPESAGETRPGGSGDENVVEGEFTESN